MNSTMNSELRHAFENQQINPAEFRHADHVAVAYAMLRKYEFIEATAKYANTIRAIATQAGVPEKFNTTITLAFMSLIAERMETTEHTDYGDFIRQNQDLLAKEILAQWYSPERLQSDLARQIFLLPTTA